MRYRLLFAVEFVLVLVFVQLRRRRQKKRLVPFEISKEWLSGHADDVSAVMDRTPDIS
jgi:hypothetical protein